MTSTLFGESVTKIRGFLLPFFYDGSEIASLLFERSERGNLFRGVTSPAGPFV